MVDLDALYTGIKTKMATDTTIAAELGNKVVVGIVPESAAGVAIGRPYCSMLVVTDSPEGIYANAFLDQVTIQFTVWSDDAPTGSDLVRRIGQVLSGQKLSLSLGTSVGCLRVSGIRQRTDPVQSPPAFVYGTMCDIRFSVFSQG